MCHALTVRITSKLDRPRHIPPCNAQIPDWISASDPGAAVELSYITSKLLQDMIPALVRDRVPGMRERHLLVSLLRWPQATHRGGGSLLGPASRCCRQGSPRRRRHVGARSLGAALEAQHPAVLLGGRLRAQHQAVVFLDEGLGGVDVGELDEHGARVLSCAATPSSAHVAL